MAAASSASDGLSWPMGCASGSGVAASRRSASSDTLPCSPSSAGFQATAGTGASGAPASATAS
ncbi:MAG: hypothetical protein U1F43_11150 [Myxococcota bacterium]